jgi:acetate kinase
MREPILVINAGSSSVKFSTFETAPDRSLLVGPHGQVEGIGTSPCLNVRGPEGQPLVMQGVKRDDHVGAIAAVHEWFAAHIGCEAALAGVGHRVVHGGAAYSEPAFIDDKVMADLAQLAPLAPLHQPHNLAAIQAVALTAPRVPQIACFDTAFHRGQPAVAQEFALPAAYRAKGVQRYGFHGLSYEYIVSALAEVASGTVSEKLVVAHLGNGASMCAIHKGSSVARPWALRQSTGSPWEREQGRSIPASSFTCFNMKVWTRGRSNN